MRVGRMGFAWGGMHHLHDRDLYHLPLTACPGCAGQWLAVLSFLLAWVRGAAPWCRQVLCFCIHFVWFIGYAFLGASRWIHLPTMRVVYPHICHLQTEVDRGGLQHGRVRCACNRVQREKEGEYGGHNVPERLPQARGPGVARLGLVGMLARIGQLWRGVIGRSRR